MSSSSTIEREYKYRVELKPGTDLSRYQHSRFDQGYLAIGHTEARIRCDSKGRYHLGMKQGAGFERTELEVELPAYVGAKVLAAAPRRVEKTRYHVDGWELDVFEGVHAGLVIAEYEVAGAHDDHPPLPEFVAVAVDVTWDPAYKNQALARP